MLQRSIITQKRHLEQSLARCKIRMPRSTFSIGQQTAKSTRRSSNEGKHLLEPVAHHAAHTNAKVAHDEVTQVNSFLEISPFVAALSSTAAADQLLKSIKSSTSLSSLFFHPDRFRKFAESLAQSRTPRDSLRVLELASNLGCGVKQNVYECVSFRLAASKDWDEVLEVVALGKRHTGRTTSRLLNWRARALVETQDYALLQRILEEFKSANQVPTQRTYHLILTGCLRNHDLGGARRCLQNMTKSNYPPNPSTHALIAKFYQSFGADLRVRQQALESLPALLPPTGVSVLNSLLQASLELQDLPSSIQFLSLFEPSSVRTFLSLISSDHGGSDNAGLSKAAPRTAAPYGQNLIANAATFAVFINYRATKSDLSGALRLIEEMSSFEVKATPGVIAALVHAYFSAGFGNTAIRMVACMCIDTPASTFQPLMVGFRDGDDALPLDPSSIPPTIQIFNVLLREILQRQGLGLVNVLLSIFRTNDLRPNAQTVEILLSYLKNVEGAHPRILLHVLRRFSSSSIRPTLRHLRIIISCILRQEKYMLYGNGWRTFAAKYPVSPNEPTRKLSVTTTQFDPTAGIVLRKSVHRSFTQSLLESMIARDIKSDSMLMALRIRLEGVLKRDMESAQAVFRTMLARGMHPNAYHFSALMEGYVLSGNLVAAQGVLRSAEQAGVKPNVVMFTILIAGHARKRDPDRALRTFHRMITAEISPDVASIDALASAFYAVGAYAITRRMLISLWDYIAPFPATLRHASLKVLASHFRNLDPSGAKTVKLSKLQRLSLHREVKKLLKAFHHHFGVRRPPRHAFSRGLEHHRTTQFAGSKLQHI
ncbi:hypothetical protein B0H34DRAFT_41328 [Crassisporium funariophilum]|nr:hypothetical protein B0H34DRAFT_41328 [Crassisporium funariophilum]